MAEAGLTAGAFYFHFPSKEALFSEAVTSTLEARRSSLKDSPVNQPGWEGLAALIKGYLSRSHRDDIAGGCAFPSLTPDMGRASEPARTAFEQQISRFVASVEEKLANGGEQRREDAIGIVAQLIGGVMLARAVPDKEFSDQILLACRRAALGTAGPSSGTESAHQQPSTPAKNASNPANQEKAATGRRSPRIKQGARRSAQHKNTRGDKAKAATSRRTPRGGTHQ